MRAPKKTGSRFQWGACYSERGKAAPRPRPQARSIPYLEVCGSSRRRMAQPRQQRGRHTTDVPQSPDRPRKAEHSQPLYQSTELSLPMEAFRCVFARLGTLRDHQTRAEIDMAFCVAEPTPKAYWTKRLAARVAGVRSTQDGQHTDADEPDPPTQPLGTGPCGVAASSNGRPRYARHRMRAWPASLNISYPS